MLDLSTLTTAQQVSLLYIGYYDRAGEPDGATFWNSAIDAPDFTVSNAADQFATQPETLAAYPFLGSPTAEEAESFITDVYQNLFNRDPDGPDSLTQEQIDAGEVSGLEFWSDVLLGAIAGTNDFSVGQIILAIAGGAQGDDQVTLLNKVNVGVAWTDAAAGRGFGDTPFADLPADVQANAASIIAPVTDAQATVEAATAEIAAIFAPAPVEGNTIFLTSSTDVTGMPGIESSDDDDMFLGYIAQNGFTGGVSNSLSSADRLDGMGGNDTLFAELSSEFVGATSNGVTIDVQPKLTSIERVELEARDMGNNGVIVNQSVDIDISGDNQQGGDLNQGDDNDSFEGEQFNEFNEGIFEDGAFDIDQTADIPDAVFTPIATFDGKDAFGINEIGSVDSDGDLLIENLNTLVNEDDAVGRKTADMTILMDHTDNFNSDGDASDLVVYFDENYLLANDPVQAGAQLTIELMDLDETTIGGNPLEDNPFGLITFNFGDELKTLDYGTNSNTYAELLADIQAAIDLAAQTDPDFSQLSASFGPIFTVRDTDDDPNPARPPLDGTTIVITNSGPEILEAVEMRATGSQPAGKDFHTGFDNEAPEEENFKIEVDIDLHKVGRGGEGGNLIVGGKDQGDLGKGIHVFNVDVLGAGEDDPNGAPSKPSNLGVLTSTNGDLQTVNIETHADFVNGDTFASLTIREGFGDNEDLMMVNANDFLGDLTLGNVDAVEDLDTLTALGGGDITFFGELTGNETDQDYVYLTGAGEDAVSVLVLGDSLDYANSSLEIKTGDGGDSINVDFAIASSATDATNEQLNQAVLDNVDINGEAGDDVINVDGIGNANIDGGSGDDIIYTDGDANEGVNAIWAFNFDNARVDDQDPTQPNIDIAPEDLPGVETSLAYLDGASVTVTLSGAGIGSLGAGGGVMALPLEGAVDGDDGYESTVIITDLINGNDYYGDQRDVNAAIIKAIEEDPVLDALLSVSIAANNTLVIASKTSGNFAAEDIRIDIEHGTATDSSYANAVLAEARSEFSDSSLTLTDLWGTTTFTSAASYQTDDGDAPGALFSDSVATNAWYDGLSVPGDTILTNSANDNLHTVGAASASETDNVINGGTGDDIIVMSTDAFADTTPDFTDGGNNAMINGASNETIEMDGMFGDDTVMNFTTANSQQILIGEPIPQEVGVVSEALAGADGSDAVAAQLILDVDVLVNQTGDTTVTIFDQTVVIPAGTDETGVTTALTGLTYAGGFVAAVDAVDSSLVVFTNPDDSLTEGVNPALAFSQPAILPTFVTQTPAVAAQTVDPATFTISFADEDAGDVTTDASITILGTTFTVVDGDLGQDIADTVEAGGPITVGTGQTWTPDASAGDGTVTFTFADTVDTNNAGELPDFTDTAAFDFGIEGVADIVVDVIADGLDFLDFTSYLTSLEDLSVNNSSAPDSDVSNTFIPVTLDFDLLDVQANEVSVVTFDNTDDSNETFAGLSESVVEQLFNNGGSFTGFGDDQNYGSLAASAANADDEYAEPADGTDPLVAGAAKSIVMIENADNLGEYKVFELSWNGDASNDSDTTLDGVVDATLIGSLDFGTSLDGLDEVNLVGSSDYDLLNTVGIQNYV